MVTIKKDFKFKHVKNFLAPEEQDILNRYTQYFHLHNREYFDPINCCLDTFRYADPLMETMLVKKLPLMIKETNLNLLPTYSYWRMYTHLSDLPAHKDKPSCEISATIKINSCGTKWPIYMAGESIELENGDAVIYLGCELEHYREEFEGDFCSQVFLHYVDANGSHKEFEKNKRRFLGGDKY
jgi:hypothetical protein